MATLYSARIAVPEDNPDAFEFNISVAGTILVFKFQWAVVSSEQEALVIDYVNNKMKSDPLVERDSHGHIEYNYSYDWINFYLQFVGKTDEELNAWLDNNTEVPMSIEKAVRASQLLMIKARRTEAMALKQVLDLYKETCTWQFQMSHNNQVTCGVIRPGGWFHTEDPNLSFRFVAEVDHIRKNDLSITELEIEVS